MQKLLYVGKIGLFYWHFLTHHSYEWALNKFYEFRNTKNYCLLITQSFDKTQLNIFSVVKSIDRNQKYESNKSYNCNVLFWLWLQNLRWTLILAKRPRIYHMISYALFKNSFISTALEKISVYKCHLVREIKVNGEKGMCTNFIQDFYIYRLCKNGHQIMKSFSPLVGKERNFLSNM